MITCKLRPTKDSGRRASLDLQQVEFTVVDGKVILRLDEFDVEGRYLRPRELVFDKESWEEMCDTTKGALRR